jgi:ATP-binding cassette subfamily F protein 3
LEHGELTDYHGNYDEYLAAREARGQALTQAAKQQARELAKVERFIERFRYKNTKARQVQARIRALGKVERVRTQRAPRKVRFGFPGAPRSGDVVVRAEAACKSYGDHVVYDGLDLVLRRGERVALVSPNGTGKSTLLKLIAGRLAPDAGRLELGHNVEVHYYAQHQLDDLDAGSTLIEEMERAAPERDRLELRRLLGCFLFTGDEIEKKIAVLSGGEKARLALAKLLVRPANLLLLDEPTNHLDLRSREVLEEALNEYDGTLVVVSHDRYFINRVATSVGEILDGRVDVVPGDYDEFLAWKRRRAAEAPAPGDEVRSADAARRRRREQRRRSAEERNRRYRERRAAERRLAPLEADIAEVEARVRELGREQADPTVYADPVRAAEVGRARAEAEARLERLYADWEALAREVDPD